MEHVLLTALGVGGATLVGALLGFVFKKISHTFSDIVLGFAAGVMLCAAVVGLILPALGDGKGLSLLSVVGGIFAGAVCLNLIDRLVPHLHSMAGKESESHPESSRRIDKVFLFVLAIAIHNLPEGIAAGVGFATGDVSGAFSVALGIALQNIPEGMVIIGPMLAAGVSRKKTLLVAAGTGVIEVLGTFIGYFAARHSAAVLPFALAFAGGTMLYVISDEMIPETHAHGHERGATYALLVGFCLMLAMDALIG
ncbi:MAG: ZIP family metal transporter [Clostridia bacterium]|nr:ZIP family metal transporter [Clostridia bacterium]